MNGKLYDAPCLLPLYYSFDLSHKAIVMTFGECNQYKPGQWSVVSSTRASMI